MAIMARLFLFLCTTSAIVAGATHIDAWRVPSSAPAAFAYSAGPTSVVSQAPTAASTDLPTISQTNSTGSVTATITIVIPRNLSLDGFSILEDFIQDTLANTTSIPSGNINVTHYIPLGQFVEQTFGCHAKPLGAQLFVLAELFLEPIHHPKAARDLHFGVVVAGDRGLIGWDKSRRLEVF